MSETNSHDLTMLDNPLGLFVRNVTWTQKFKLVAGVGKGSRSVTCRHPQMNAGCWARRWRP